MARLRRAGFAPDRRRCTTRVFAAVSHLPHLLAFALVDEFAGRADRDRCSTMPPADSATSRASPPAIRRCGATSAWPTATSCMPSCLRYQADTRCAARDARAGRRGRARAGVHPGARRAQRLAAAREQGRDQAALGAAPVPPCARWNSPPFTASRGRVRLPGSKSISNRVLLLAALAEGETRLVGLLESDDTRVMLRRAGAARRPLRARGRGAVRARRRRRAPGHARRTVSRQRGHRVPPADRGAGARRRRLPPLGRARACTSGRSATWSMPCGSSAHASTISAAKAFRRSPSTQAPAADGRASARRRCGARRCVQPVSHRAADGAAADRRGERASRSSVS